MKAVLKTFRQSPRKVRLLADLIRGKKVADAKVALAFADKRSAPIISKLIDSAIANAKENASVSSENLFIKTIFVDKGVTLKRIMPRARGTAARINKRTSHIKIELEAKDDVSKKSKKTLKAKKNSN